jgi:hypothetical protein
MGGPGSGRKKGSVNRKKSKNDDFWEKRDKAYQKMASSWGKAKKTKYSKTTFAQDIKGLSARK